MKKSLGQKLSFKDTVSKASGYILINASIITGEENDLVAYAVSRLNIRHTTALSENICPKVLFTGIPVDYRKELQLAFGDYVEAYEGTTNTMMQ